MVFICLGADDVLHRESDIDHVAIPSLLATAAVHHHLIREGLRTSVGLVVETGEAKLVHDFCLLAGYGAEAINPYLALDTISTLAPKLPEPLSEQEAHKRYIKALDKGILKVMSKMGISTYQSYCGAQIFDAVGLASDFVDKYFTGTASVIEGVGLREIARETVRQETKHLKFAVAERLNQQLIRIRRCRFIIRVRFDGLQQTCDVNRRSSLR